MPSGIQDMNRDQLLEAVGNQYSKITQQEHRIKELERLVFGFKSERFVPEAMKRLRTLLCFTHFL
jgi:hypothetical protein